VSLKIVPKHKLLCGFKVNKLFTKKVDDYDDNYKEFSFLNTVHLSVIVSYYFKSRLKLIHQNLNQ